MKRLFPILTWATVAVTASAQMTTSSMDGVVMDATGEVAGATVRVIHTPSGTIYGAITNAQGRYTINGMRVGGPYKVIVSFIGYETQEQNGIMLQLGQTFTYNAHLNESVALLQEAVVTSNAVDATKTGAAFHISTDRLRELPSVNQSLDEMVRLSPQLATSAKGAISIAGMNTKYNAVQIDGAMQNDNFGLTDTGLNGAQASTNAFSMETIEQLQVNVAPFDVRQSGFTGGLINATTKSGTNDVHGSVYSYYQNQNLISDKYELRGGGTSAAYDSQRNYTIGVTLGGPIIKDKLFFFVNYEKCDNKQDNLYGLGADASKVDAAEATNILTVLKQRAAEQGYNYTGTLGTRDDQNGSDKFGVKLDWNINERHHASLRYSLVDASNLRYTSSATELNASDYTYNLDNTTHSLTFELNSRLGDKMFNELHATYTSVNDERTPQGSNFPMVQISQVGDGTLNLGNDRSAMANAIYQKIFTLTDNFSWYLGNHNLTAGINFESYDFENLFIQDYYGSYYFNSPDDFYNGIINRFRYGQGVESVTGTSHWSATFGAGILGFYVQDKWNITPTFDLTYGLRLDSPLMYDTPTANADFAADAQANGWGNLVTDTRLSSAPMWSPRVGFRWDINDDNSAILRGGVGIFTGRVPFVWLSNSFSNTGIQQLSYSVYPDHNKNDDGTYVANSNYSSTHNINFILDPSKVSENLPASRAGVPAKSAQTINVFNKKFRYSQQLRFDLAFDYTDPLGIQWTAEGIFNKTINDMVVRNYNITATGKDLSSVTGVEADNRPLYKLGSYSAVYVLDNVSKGYGYNLSLQAMKSFDFGLDLMASYAYCQSYTINNGSSSVAASNWQYNYTHSDPNNPELERSYYCTPNQVKLSAYYHLDWNKVMNTTSHRTTNRTTFGLVYVGHSGVAYNYYVNGDINGDGGYNDLLYIPTDEEVDEMNFRESKAYTADEQKANFKSWIASDDYLKNHRGQYYDRNADTEEWQNRIDFHIDHRFGFLCGKDMRYVEIGFDIVNLSNMFNKSWGEVLSSDTYSYYSPLSATVARDSNGEVSSVAYQFNHPADYDPRSYDDFYSRWRGQFSLKLTF